MMHIALYQKCHQIAGFFCYMEKISDLVTLLA